MFSGFTQAYREYLIPNVMHVNIDGAVPDINITTGNMTSTIRFLLCLRTNDDEPNDADFITPYIVLAGDKVNGHKYTR